MSDMTAGSDRVWYTGRDGAPSGPFTPSEIQNQIRSGKLVATDVVWGPDWPDWRSVGEVYKLPPPIPLQHVPPRLPSKVPAKGTENRSETPAIAAVPQKKPPRTKARYSFGGQTRWLALGAGAVLLAAGLGGTMHMMRGHHGAQPPITFGRVGERVEKPVLSPDGKYAALYANVFDSKFDKSTMQLWDFESGKLEVEIKGFTGRPYTAVFSADSQKLFVGTSDGKIWVWTVGSSGYPNILVQNKTYDRVDHLQIENGGKWLAAVITENDDRIYVRTFDPATGAMLSQSLSSKGYIGAYSVNAALDRLIAYHGSKTDVVLMELSSGDVLKTLSEDGYSGEQAALSPGGALAATSGETGFAFWNVKEGTINRKIELDEKFGQVHDLAFDDLGSKLAVGTKKGWIFIYNAHSGELTRKFKGHAGEVRTHFSSDGTKLITSWSRDWTAKVWDLDTEKVLRTWPLMQRELFSVPGNKTVMIEDGFDRYVKVAIDDSSLDGASRIPTGRYIGGKCVERKSDGATIKVTPAIEIFYREGSLVANTMMMSCEPDSYAMSGFTVANNAILSASAPVLQYTLRPDSSEVTGSIFKVGEGSHCSIRPHETGFLSVSLTDAGQEAVVSLGNAKSPLPVSLKMFKEVVEKSENDRDLDQVSAEFIAIFGGKFFAALQPVSSMNGETIETEFERARELAVPATSDPIGCGLDWYLASKMSGPLLEVPR